MPGTLFPISFHIYVIHQSRGTLISSHAVTAMHIGPAPPPGLAAPTEHLPNQEHAVLKGHDGPVLSVRFNTQGTYCLSCGKVGGPEVPWVQ
jgi:hypothetical protein